MYTKGLDLLIESFTAFSKEYPESRLWLIGDGAEKEKLHQQIKQNSLENKVELMGSKFGEEKMTLSGKWMFFCTLQEMKVFRFLLLKRLLSANLVL